MFFHFFFTNFSCASVLFGLELLFPDLVLHNKVCLYFYNLGGHCCCAVALNHLFFVPAEKLGKFWKKMFRKQFPKTTFFFSKKRKIFFFSQKNKVCIYRSKQFVFPTKNCICQKQVSVFENGHFQSFPQIIIGRRTSSVASFEGDHVQ